MDTLLHDNTNFINNDDNEEESSSYASLLPIEVVIHVMEFLSYSDRIVASQVCQLWYEALFHQKFCNQEKVVVRKCCSEALAIFRNPTRPYLHVMFIDAELNIKMREFWDNVTPKLKSLYFGNCDMSDKIFMDILSSCYNLESLVIDNCRELFMLGRLLTMPQDVRALSKALQKLHELSLCNNRYLSDAILNRLVSVMPNLKIISLEGCQMNYHEGLYKKYYPDRLIVEKLDFASESVLTFQNFYKIVLKRAGMIKNINLSGTLLDSSALSNISQVKGLQLDTVHLVRCEQLTNTGILSLVQHQSQLVALDLSYCSRVTDQALVKICKNLSSLRKLAVRNCRAITSMGVVNLKYLLNLEEVDISQCELVSGNGISEGLCSKLNKKILKLSMEGLNTITSDTVISIAENLPNLVYLNLSYCFNAVTDSSVQAIFQHQRLLRSLKLSCCDAVTDFGLTGMGVDATELDTPSGTLSVTIVSEPRQQISLRSKAEEEIVQDAYRKFAVRKICELKLGECSRVGYSLGQLKSLQELDLRHCNKITDESLKHSFRFLELHYLNLSQCQQITDIGLQAIGKNNPSIDMLNLSQCYNITDEGILALTSTLHRLKYLDIQGCNQLTEASVLAIVEHCQQLRYLNASHCSGMTDKISELLHRLPKRTFFSRTDEPSMAPQAPPPPLLR